MSARDRIFEMYVRPLWNWTLDLLQDPQLADFFVWDAERAYIFDGNEYIRFFTEPWTAEAMWEVPAIYQFNSHISRIPDSPDHKFCPYILYTDKAKLSSFGTQKGYPVVARLASDWGGGQIVGWLPVLRKTLNYVLRFPVRGRARI
ncbi:hypothetical protein B0H14DRAFT_2637012 [Mycena olivaceomarginata]|nr:hypothetical protein B0H14DRAFT_2637012 [Mycena olivaceomarginata]